MKILYSPQVRYDSDKYKITISGEAITIQYHDKTETFDFTGMPNGIGEVESEVFDFEPIISAKRVNGVLWVEILNLIGIDATHEERFPEWLEVGQNGNKVEE